MDVELVEDQRHMQYLCATEYGSADSRYSLKRLDLSPQNSLSMATAVELQKF